VLQGIETQIAKANTNKENMIRHRQRMEQEVSWFSQGFLPAGAFERPFPLRKKYVLKRFSKK